jgi:hypothetical protein
VVDSNPFGCEQFDAHGVGSRALSFPRGMFRYCSLVRTCITTVLTDSGWAVPLGGEGFAPPRGRLVHGPRSEPIGQGGRFTTPTGVGTSRARASPSKNECTRAGERSEGIRDCLRRRSPEFFRIHQFLSPE